MGIITSCGRALLKNTTLIAGDGNFKSTPRPFMQLYTVCCKDEKSNVLPILYFFLPRKSKDIYDINFKIEKTYTGDNLLLFMTDFELAAIQAVKEQFKEKVKVQQCFIHFKHTLKRQAKKKGLTLDSF